MVGFQQMLDDVTQVWVFNISNYFFFLGIKVVGQEPARKYHDGLNLELQTHFSMVFDSF